ncbi:MAG TPA: M48 family metalloprotease [Candidatus Deferrimicrobiaceae bacterium]|jgi:Zn-dependent protease with chaperone function
MFSGKSVAIGDQWNMGPTIFGGNMKLIIYRRTYLAIVALSIVLLLACGGAFAADQHDIEVLVDTLNSSIPAEAVRRAQEFDDKLLSTGEFDGGKVYLVTDDRVKKLDALVNKLLGAMGADTSSWIVRVLDTDPRMVNAFVAGGKYIYIYTGLLAQATSDDELAFVLSHELGHSLLQHRIRSQKDGSSTVAGLAVIGAALSKKNRGALLDFAKTTTASYSRLDEEEADAIGVAIARKAGFDSIRGADFFSRLKRQQEKELAAMKQEVVKGQADCQQKVKRFNSSIFNQTTARRNEVNAFCQDVENKRLAYIARVENSGENSVAYSNHPMDQNRIAAIAVINDYLQKRRELDTFKQYQQSYRVMVALNKVDSVLLKSPEKEVSAAPSKVEETARPGSGQNLVDQLALLKKAKDQGLLTDMEYEKKREDILSRF